MNCTKCGTEIGEGAAFCAQCGAPVSARTQDQAEVKAEDRAEDQGQKRPRVIWSILLGIALFGTASAMFIPAIAGMRQNPMSGYSAMIWGSAFFYALWRYRLKTGWHGALIGVVVGILLFTLAAFVGGYVRASGGV